MSPKASEKNERQQLKGKSVSEIFTRFHKLSHCFITFPPGPSPSKQRVLAQGEQKRRKDNKKNRTNRLVRIFSGGVGVCASRGGGQKVRYVPRNQGNQTFLAGYPGILPGYPGGAREVWEKKVCVHFSFPILQLQNFLFGNNYVAHGSGPLNCNTGYYLSGTPV